MIDGKHLFKVSYQDGYETYFSPNVLFHPQMTEETFKKLIQEAVQDVEGETFISDIEDYLVQTHHFQRIPCTMVNTKHTLKGI